MKSDRLGLFSELLPFIRSNAMLSAMIVVFKLLSTAVLVLAPLVYKYYIVNVIVTGDLRQLTLVIAGYLAVFGLQTVAALFSKYSENKFANRLRVKIKKRLFAIYTGMKYKEFESWNAGDIALQIETDSGLLTTFYINHCVNFVFHIVGAVAMLVVVFIMNWYLALFGLLMIAASLYITKVLARKIHRLSEQYRGNQGEFESAIGNALRNWKEIRTNNLEDNENRLFTNKWSELSQLSVKRAFYQYFQGALIAFNICFVTRMNLYFFGGVLIIRNKMSVATMLVFMNYYEQIFSSVQAITDSIVELSKDAPQLRGIFAILKQGSSQKPAGSTLQRTTADLKLERVSFSYQSSAEYALQDITVEIPVNRKTAVIGKSGCGKSTLMKLLLGLYEPDSGSVRLGTADIGAIPAGRRGHLINGVMQDPQFLNMSVAENLRMAKPDASGEELDQACKMAHIHDFIQSMPEKYATIIGERGIKLSGGQKQRLAIARTLLTDPEIIVFDEATSALDSENENMIVQAVQELSQQKTIIFISHRFASIADADNVIALDGGRVIAQGRMKELLENDNLLHSLFPEQTKRSVAECNAG